MGLCRAPVHGPTQLPPHPVLFVATGTRWPEEEAGGKGTQQGDSVKSLTAAKQSYWDLNPSYSPGLWSQMSSPAVQCFPGSRGALAETHRPRVPIPGSPSFLAWR